MREYEYAAATQGKILDKYGTLYGISRDLIDRIGAGTATPEELTAYTENADRLVDKFKTDMRRTHPDDYTDLDIEIIVGMDATKYANFQSRNDPFVKIVPADQLLDVLGKNQAPTFFGFAASKPHSEGNSPEQNVSQFGLDYTTTDKDGKTQTPYLVNGKPQPFLYTMESPMTDEIRRTAKLPLEPRIFERIERIAADPTSGDIMREMAQMLTKPGVVCLIVRNEKSESDTKAVMASYTERGYTIKKSLDAPYTANGMSQYGTNLDGTNAFSDLIQEMYIDTSEMKALAGVGTAYYMNVPKQESSSSDDPSLPRGSDRLKISEWNGRDWERTATEEKLDQFREQALSVLPEEADKKIVLGRLVTNDALTTAAAEGKAKGPAGTKLDPLAKKGIKDREDRVKRRIVEDTAGSTAALRFSAKDSDKDRKKKRKKKKDADADKRRDSQRKRPSSGE